jgi:hypothetical protein
MNKQQLLMNNNQLLLKYAGLTFQFLIGIGLFTFLGIKIDAYFKWKMPIAVWVLPLIFIVAIIVKIVLDTSKKNKPND